jgi:hypothetical protein
MNDFIVMASVHLFLCLLDFLPNAVVLSHQFREVLLLRSNLYICMSWLNILFLNDYSIYLYDYVRIDCVIIWKMFVGWEISAECFWKQKHDKVCSSLVSWS